MSRHPWADNLKVTLVAGVILAHSTMAWTGFGNWVLTVPPIGEPLLSLVTVAAALASLFGMPTFFLISGLFSVPSLARKGPGRFLRERAVRLGVPLLIFIVCFAPFIEYVDSSNAGWTRGLWALTLETVWFSWPLPPAWGPAWFLAVLLVFSAGYAAVRTAQPRSRVDEVEPRRPLRPGLLIAIAIAVAAASFAIRIRVPLGDEAFRLALGQSPGWLAGFVLGVAGAERGWLTPPTAATAALVRRVGWALCLLVTITIGALVAFGLSFDDLAGGGSVASLVLAIFEGGIVVTMPLWLVDLFGRRFRHQGALARALSRGAFAAFLVHQGVLVALALTSTTIDAAPEVKYVLVSGVAVVVSFAIGTSLTRLPGLRRVL